MKTEIRIKTITERMTSSGLSLPKIFPIQVWDRELKWCVFFAYSGENAHPFRVMPHSKEKKNTG